jgi:hypothetical protein
MKVAALYVETGGCYFGLPDVEPWDEDRDARLYDGPWPIVAHPPCARWCQLAPVNQARYGLAVGDDGGCFASALAAVRRWGGVLEHPAVSMAWRTFGLPRPFGVGWQRAFCGGWVAQIEQRNYGHPARKKTWLYGYGIDPDSLRWGPGPEPEAWISADRPRAALRHVRQLGKREAAATPIAFRDLLLDIARSVYRVRQAA